MTVDVWKGTLKCTISQASHDETCSLGGNGNWDVDSVVFVEQQHVNVCKHYV